MDTPPAASSEYMLIFRGTDWFSDLSPAEIQQVMTRWYEWFDGLIADGRAKAGQPLASSGKIVAGPGGQSVTDGPFAESKEAIGGYFLLNVSGLEEAVEIAQDCPALPHGVKVEVRPIVASCDAAGAAFLASATATA